MINEMNKFKSIYFLLTINMLLFSSCNNSQKVTIGNKINNNDRKAVHLIAHEIYQSFKKKNSSYLKEIASIRFNNNLYFFDTLVNQIDVNPEKDEMTVLGEVLVNSSVTSNIDKVEFSNGGIKDFNYEFQHTGSPLYIYIFTVPGHHPGNTWIFLTGFIHENNTWKVLRLEVFCYQYKNNALPDLYIIAKEKYKEGDVLTAYLYMQQARYISFPSTGSFHYKSQPEIDGFTKQLEYTINKNITLPTRIQGVATFPDIIKIDVKPTPLGLIPRVVYKSKIDIKDTVSLKKENDLVASFIDIYLPNITKFAEGIKYEVVNQYTIDNPQTLHHIFLKEKK